MAEKEADVVQPGSLGHNLLEPRVSGPSRVGVVDVTPAPTTMLHRGVEALGSEEPRLVPPQLLAATLQCSDCRPPCRWRTGDQGADRAGWGGGRS